LPLPSRRTLEFYREAGSTANIEGLLVTYASGQYDTIGSPDAVNGGQWPAGRRTLSPSVQT
jgi:hypothetical protein